MNLSRLILPLAAMAALSACDDEAYRDPVDPLPDPPPLESPPTAEAPVTAPAEVEIPSVTPREEPQSSDESVQPESETLFY